jgi:FkbM family methyltransferase
MIKQEKNMNYLRYLTNTNRAVRWLLYPLLFLRRLILHRKELANRKIMKNLSDIMINEPFIDIPAFKGHFAINSKSDIFFRIVTKNEYEQDQIKCVEKYLITDLDVIDVGANIGLYTVLFAKTIGDSSRVLSIEPTSGAFKLLEKNIIDNHINQKAIAFNGAVMGGAGVSDIKTIRGKEEYSTLGDLCHPSARNENIVIEKVTISTIDDLVKQFSLNPGFIKIDTEGSELEVLKGAETTLKNYRPVILSELSDHLLKANGSSSSEVISFLNAMDYDIFDPVFPSAKVRPKKFGDIICFPREKSIKF